MNIETRLLSSLEKIFPTGKIEAKELTSFSALKGEKFSFQLACLADSGNLVKATVGINSDLKDCINLYSVKNVPVNFPCYQEDDQYFISKEPGLYPDLLVQYEGDFHLMGGQWRSLWVEINLPQDVLPCSHEIEIVLFDSDEKLLTSRTFTLNVINEQLPEQELLCTHWFHSDCLSEYYHLEPLSEDHWQAIDNYMTNYREYGMNMILTPIFTPALDTEIGGERPTVQLVSIEKSGSAYLFDFTKLDRFMSLAESHHIDYFEMAHLFTQWGAKATPKIVLTNGERIFGWDVPATNKEYVYFINLFITELKAHLGKNGRLERCWFHISDEPSDEHIESYKEAVNVVSKVLEGCNMMDALSEYKFYKQGLVKTPIPCNDHIDEFIENGVEPLWTYYCCAQGKKNVSNRFIAMPSCRNRILGLQLYKYNIVGFLHWGYNFWFSHLSKGLIDPYFITDADEAFPAGDPFLVYPRADKTPAPSIRQIVFHEALQDLRALRALEKYMSQEEIVAALEGISGQITFSDYPHGSEFMLKTRSLINQLITDNVK